MPPEELISQNGLDFVHWLEEDATNLVDDPDVGYVVANFSDVDDLLGHPAGDELLQRISRRFAAVVAEGVETTNAGRDPARDRLWVRPGLPLVTTGAGRRHPRDRPSHRRERTRLRRTQTHLSPT